MPPASDLERLKTEYHDRAERLRGSDVYSPLNTAYLYMIQARQRAATDLLRRLGIQTLTGARILEIGCGQGDVLHEWMFQRVGAGQLYGVDLLPERLVNARQRFPGVGLAAADAQTLPFASAQFDFVLQYTVFSSILDGEIRANIAREMRRVLKPGGVLISYDFWLNPTNAQTEGIGSGELRRLFPGCRLTTRRVTLAPPLARRLARRSWMLCHLLEKLTVLNTHLLVAVQPDVP